MTLARLVADKTWPEASPNLPGAFDAWDLPSASSIDEKSAPFAGTTRCVYAIT
jgi:hypothetical protein